MNKKEMFYDEIMYIKDKNLQRSCCYFVEQLPDYFFKEAASSTGKYHPKYAIGEGGLLRHTKAAVRIAQELLADPAIGNHYTSREKDLMIMALLLHDGFKKGIKEERYTRFDHPLIAADFIYSHKGEANLSEEDALFLKKAISSHMGPWTTDYKGNEALPAPETKWENFVHMCDYLASRKCLLVPFDKDNTIAV